MSNKLSDNKSKQIDNRTLNGELGPIEEENFRSLKIEIQKNTGVYCHNDGHIKACAENITKLINWTNSISGYNKKIAAEIKCGIMIVHDELTNIDFVLISAGSLNDIIQVGVRSSFNSRLARIGLENVDNATTERIKSQTFLKNYRSLKRRWTVKDGTKFFQKYMNKKPHVDDIPEKKNAANEVFDGINLFHEIFNDFESLDDILVGCLNVENPKQC